MGVARANDLSELARAIQAAQVFDSSVLVERFIEGKELAVGILDGRVLGAIEIAPRTGVYDFHAKYTPGMTDYFMPARLAAARYRAVLSLAERAACALDTSGAVRVDLLVTEGHNEYVLEVNTLPGMTETSLLPKIAAAAGFGFAELCEAILERATLYTGTRRRPLAAAAAPATAASAQLALDPQAAVEQSAARASRRQGAGARSQRTRTA